jgi:predicted MFS family arabinose efflux permease
VGSREQLGQAFRALGQVVANPLLRRLQLAAVGSTLGSWAYTVAIAVYAYESGGAKAVAVICFARWGLAALLAPWLALPADRYSRRLVMLTADLIRVGLLAGMCALAALDGPALAVYVLAVGTSIVSTAFHPAQQALLPSLAQTPEELTAANVSMSTISSVGMFAGPALGGVLLAFSGASLVFAVTAVSFAWSALCLVRIPRDAAPARHPDDARIVPALLGGFRAIAFDPALRVVVGVMSAQTLVCGAFEVLLVVIAIRMLHAGNAGVGWLNAAVGVGGVLGAVAVTALAGRKRLAGDLGIGALLWGVPLALVAVWTNLGFVLLLFAIIGMGNTIVDVAGITLMQRTAADEVLARVFGVLESLMLATLAIGSIVTPAIIASLGPKTTLVVVGLVLPALLLPAWPTLRRVDATGRIPVSLDLMRAVSIFAPLPPPVLERLAASAAPVTVPAGGTVFTQGEPGDRFYVVETGRAEIAVDGEPVRTVGRGDFFGEIALLRDVPRTATVRAVEELHLYAIERDDFIAAVTGHAPSLAAAESVVATRLPAGVLV